MDDTHFTITVFIALLLVASGVAMASKRVRVPYTLMLVIVGLIVSPMHFLPVVHISPELILLIFLPALLFEAAWNLKLEALRKNLLPILTLAIAGVVLSVGVIGLILHYAVGLSWPVALLFGAMISATDPISVLAIFRKLGLSSRLTTIVEGESLFNDGTAVVVFGIVLDVVVGTAAGSSGELLWGSLREFTLVVVGGVAAGAAVGFLASTVTSYFDDHLLEITLTTIAAYGSFLIAETIRVSPVIAVLIVGLVLGNHGRRIGMSPTTQVAVTSFWEYAAFVVNSLVFLLIGLEIQLPTLASNLPSVGWAVLAILAARAAAVYGLVPLSNLASAPVPGVWRHVLFWGGLRGSLSIALVLSLPTSLPSRAQLVVMIFGTVIFSLLVQGLTISPLLKFLRLRKPALGLRQYELLHGRLLMETAALAELERLRNRGRVTERVFNALREEMSRNEEDVSRQLDQLAVEQGKLDRQQERNLRRHLIDVRKSRLTELLREGALSEETHRELSGDLDEIFTRAEAESENP